MIKSLLRKRNILLTWAIFAMSMSSLAVNVNLNFFVGNEKIFTSSVEAGGTYTIADYDPTTMAPYECREYSFVGWRVGTPVKGDTVPHIDTQVTPIANVNIYAVFYKAVVNDFTRITTVEELEADADYLIVSNHVFGGENHFYAMNGIMGTYEYDKYKSWGKLGAERVYPINGTVHDPQDNCIWRLHSRTETAEEPGLWWWSIGNQGLYIGNTKKYWFLNSPAERGHTGVVINAINGNFEMKSYALESNTISADTIHIDADTIHNPADTVVNIIGDTVIEGVYTLLYDTIIYPAKDSIVKDTTIILPEHREYARQWWYLKYVDDEITMVEDFFITGQTMNNYPLYIYKKESAYTSYLSCVTWTSHLNAVEGKISVDGSPKTMDITEQSPGCLWLPEAFVPDAAGCTGWGFIGWSLDQPVTPTLIAPTVRPAHACTKALYNGETLYAVYANGIKYEKVKPGDLRDGDIVVAVLDDPYPSWGMGIRALTFDGSNDNRWASDTVSILGDSVIDHMVTSNYEWTYRAYDATLWNGVHPMAKDENQDKYAFKIAGSSGSDPYKIWLNWSQKEKQTHWLSYQYKYTDPYHWLTYSYGVDGYAGYFYRDDHEGADYPQYYWEYKVYRKDNNGVYVRVSSTAELNDGDMVVIVMYDPDGSVGDYAVSHTGGSTNYFNKKAVTLSVTGDTIISSISSSKMEFVYNASNHTLSNNDLLLAHNGDSAKAYALYDATETKKPVALKSLVGSAGFFWLRYKYTSGNGVLSNESDFRIKDDETYQWSNHFWQFDLYRYVGSSDNYEKVTSYSGLADGEELVIVMRTDYENDPPACAVTYSSSSNKRWKATYVPFRSNGNIKPEHVSSKMLWTFHKSDSTFWHDGHLLGHEENSDYAFKLAKASECDLGLHDSGKGAYFWLRYDKVSSTAHWMSFDWNDMQFCSNEDVAYHHEGSTDLREQYWEFRLFRKAGSAQYTSYPHCAPYAVNLHACGGTVNAGSNTQNVTLYEDASGEGLILPTCTPGCAAEGWEFVGWFQDEDKQSFERESFDDYLPAGSRFVPVSDGVNLYAIYKKATDKFRIVRGGPSKIVPGEGEDYLFTYYTNVNGSEKMYDYEITGYTKRAKSGSNYYDFCIGKQGESPQNGDDFYMIESDSACMWRMTYVQGDDVWYMENLKTGKFLKIGTSGNSARCEMVSSPQPIYILDAGKAFEVNVCRYYNNRYYSIYCNTSGLFTDQQKGWSSQNSLYSPFSYVYRRLKEYTSWPHCEPFTVHYVGCGGTPEVEDQAEAVRYEGVVTPEAYASVECAKLGWTFAGWYKRSIDNEINQLTFDLVPPHSKYHPAQEHDTLYAVYQQKTDKYKRITSTSSLYLGGIYIVATAPNATNKNIALSNETNNGSPTSVYTLGIEVTPDTIGVIHNENPEIDWYLRGQWGEYVLYNPNRGVYLDMYEPGTVGLTSTEHDQVDITYDEAHPENGFKFRSVQNISHTSTGRKFLSYRDNYFKTVKGSETQPLAMYRQECYYMSYPICHQEVQAIYWSKGDGGDTDYHVTLEAYELGGLPDMHGSMGTPTENGDGTLLIQFHAGLLPPCSRSVVTWGGSTAELRIPFIVNHDMRSSELLGDKECDTCDIYVMKGNTLTIDENRTIRIITIEDSATVEVQDGKKLRAQQLVLFTEGDRHAPLLHLNNNGQIILKNGEIYFDRRIDDRRWYWFTLPFDAKVTDVTYSNEEANGKVAQYNSDFWIKYYDGVGRTTDVNTYGLIGQKETYWTNMAKSDALNAGQGYQIGIADQRNVPQKDGRYHTKRIMRFTMRPDGYKWNSQERSLYKGAPITGTTANDPTLASEAGWNLIGNPYLRYYNTGTVSSTGLVSGVWTQEMDNTGWTGKWILDDNYDKTVPYLTIYDPGTRRYKQVLASNYNMRPSEVVFVQVSDGNRVNFGANTNISHKPSSLMVSLREAPLHTGIKLSSNKETDRTGIVLDQDLSAQYEIGADLIKYSNAGMLNVYTIDNNKRKLAFNGMNDENAEELIPVGVTFPKAGTYTFSFDSELYDRADVDTMVLIDEALGEKVNLLFNNYTVTVDQAGTQDNRFKLFVRRIQRGTPDPSVPTVLVDGEEGDENGIKIIRNGLLYIIRDGKMYNAYGKEVEE